MKLFTQFAINMVKQPLWTLLQTTSHLIGILIQGLLILTLILYLRKTGEQNKVTCSLMIKADLMIILLRAKELTALDSHKIAHYLMVPVGEQRKISMEINLEPHIEINLIKTNLSTKFNP